MARENVNGRIFVQARRVIFSQTKGSFVWEKIQEKEMTVSEIKEAVLEEFDTDEATADKDIEALLGQLKEENLIL